LPLLELWVGCATVTHRQWFSLSRGRLTPPTPIPPTPSLHPHNPHHDLWQMYVPLGGRLDLAGGVNITCPAGHLLQDLTQGAYGPDGSFPYYARQCLPLPGYPTTVMRSSLLLGCFPCGGEEYTLKGGFSNGTAGAIENTPCKPCPSGAVCSQGTPRPLDNFWGDQDGSGVVSMALCPSEYCLGCTTESPGCNVSTCAAYRRGPLCGDCAPGYVQSVGAADCIPVSACDSDIPMLWPVVVAVVFGLSVLQLKVVSNVWSTTQRLPSTKTKALMYFAQVGGSGCRSPGPVDNTMLPLGPRTLQLT